MLPTKGAPSRMALTWVPFPEGGIMPLDHLGHGPGPTRTPLGLAAHDLGGETLCQRFKHWLPCDYEGRKPCAGLFRPWAGRQRLHLSHSAWTSMTQEWWHVSALASGWPARVPAQSQSCDVKCCCFNVYRCARPWEKECTGTQAIMLTTGGFRLTGPSCSWLQVLWCWLSGPGRQEMGSCNLENTPSQLLLA